MCEAFATSVASNLVSKLGEYLFAPIGHQFGYVLCYKSYIDDLKKEVHDLRNARERVRSSVDRALYDGKLIYTDAKDWLKSVKKAADEAEILLRDCENAKNTCFRGWLPDPVVRHPIGRKVKKMTPVIQKLLQNSTFPEVQFDYPPIGIVSATATASSSRPADNNEDFLESRASFVEQVIKALTDENVSVVGVYGPGGVGKSKLLANIERRAKKEKLFDVVAIANVSRNPDLRTIQGEIAYALGLKIMNEETTRGRADLLCRRLESDSEKNILLILDNLWTKLELNEVGIPCGYDNKARCCKLLLTSRNREVLRADMGSDKEFLLNQLDKGEARRLFERIVGDRINDPDIKPWVDGVVKNCEGLPLLIVSSAKRLKGGELAAWRIASTHRDVSKSKSLVELNFNDLEDERIRRLFLVCALDSRSIPMRCYIAYCMGLGLYKEFSVTIQKARDRLIMDLHKLQDCCLLLDGDDMEKFKMHDIFADVAISITSSEWKALVGRKDCGFKERSKEEIERCTAISMICVGIDVFPEKLNCPNLRILILDEDNPSLRMPESFFESLKNLQVLDLTQLSFTTLPSSIKFLENLNSLCLDYCNLQDVTVLGKLKGLQFLSFHGSKIARLPKEIGGLTELRFLDLTSCTCLKVIEPDVLGSLVNLEELHMEESFDQWEADDEAPRSNASLAELKNMRKLSTVTISIPHSAILPRDLPFGKLNEHKIQIGDVWHWSDRHNGSNILKLKLDSGNLLHEEWVQKCLQRTQDLHLDGLEDGNDRIGDLCVKGFQELRHLHIQNVPSIHYIFHSTDAFMILESLFLKNLNKLEKISCGCLALGSLSIVKVDNCGEIKHLFPSSMKGIISQLEEIEISRCHLMGHIIADAGEDEDKDEIDDIHMKQCNLRMLILQDLPNMTSFCKIAGHSNEFFNGQQVSLPCLESLTLSKLPNLKEIWNSQFPSDVSKLKFLEVKDCAFLLRIIPSNLLIRLWNLEEMTIVRCQLIREVVDLEGLTASEDVHILPRLTTLILSDLPALGHLWNKNSRITSCFQSLRVLKVVNCENLRFLFSSSIAKALQQIKEIKVASCGMLEEIIYAQEEESEDAASIDTLEFPLLTSLSLEELPNLRTFSCGTYCICCPSLKRLTICGCPKMMTFSSFEGKQQSTTADTGLQQVFGHINSPLSLPVLFNQNVIFPSLEELTLVSLCQLMNIWHNELSEESFCKLSSIMVRDCENLSHIFPSTLTERLRSLKMIVVGNCTSLEALVEHNAMSTALVPSFMWKRLLHCIESLTVEECPRLRNLFTMSMAKSLVRLQYLVLRGCEEMEYVVAAEDDKPEEPTNKIVFPKLATLSLCKMMKLRSFCQGKHISKWPSLKEFTVDDCEAVEAILGDASCRRPEGNVPKHQPLLLVEKQVEFSNLESMKISHMANMEKIWVDEYASNAFTKLKTLIVEYCEKLSFIFPSDDILVRFLNLEKLIVTDCDSLEVVFQVQELNMNATCSPSSFQLREIILKRLPKVKHVWSGHPRGTLAFECLRCLRAVLCASLKSIFPSSVAKNSAQLEELTVKYCGVEEIIAEEEGGVEIREGDHFFPRLTKLVLVDLLELRSFYRESHTSTWPLLRHLMVVACGKMRLFSFSGEIQSCHGDSTTNESQRTLFSAEKVIPHLEIFALTPESVAMMQHYTFPHLKRLELSRFLEEDEAFPSNFLLHRFPNLERLVVLSSSFEEIFPEEESSGQAEAILEALGKLNFLELVNLCNLRRLWKDGSLMAKLLQQIEYLILEKCPNLSIALPSPTSFQRLTQLRLNNCSGLVHMGTCSAVTSLAHLTLLIINDCGKMEDVVTDDGDGVEEVSFPKLRQLTLEGLPCLQSFSPANHAFTFPSLVIVLVKQCPKMNIFCMGALTTPRLDKVFLSPKGDVWRWEDDLNTTIQTLST